VTYSLQLYTVRKPLEDDLPGTIARVAELGFTKVEPYNFVATADALAAAFAQNGITAPSGHAPLLKDDQDEIFRAANKLGITTVIDPFVPAEQWQDAEDIQRTAAGLNAAAKKGAEYGIRVGYHNHSWELESKINGTTALEYFETLLDPELVLEVDTYWVSVGGANAVDVLTSLGERVKFIHIKDGPLTTDTKAQLPAGQGEVPVWDVIGAAKSLEVGVVEFDDYAGDIFDGIAQSLAFLNRGKA
jgi:sugar phosphate isomerase/epimerase